MKYKILFLKKKKDHVSKLNLLTNLGVPLSRLCVCVCLKEREKRREGESGKRIDGDLGLFSNFLLSVVDLQCRLPISAASAKVTQFFTYVTSFFIYFSIMVY